MAQLRHIAIHVEEPKPGRFAWVLSERDDHRWQELDKSGSPAASYHQAMADGLLALQARVPDLDVGPRGPAHEAADTATDEKAPAAAAAPATRSFFGFGPAR